MVFFEASEDKDLDFLLKVCDKNMSIHLVKVILQQVAKAMDALHDANIINVSLNAKTIGLNEKSKATLYGFKQDTLWLTAEHKYIDGVDLGADPTLNNVASKARDVYNFGRLIQVITGAKAMDAASAEHAEADNEALEKKSVKLR